MKKWNIILTCVILFFAGGFVLRYIETEKGMERRLSVQSDEIPETFNGSYYMKSQGNHIIVYNRDHTVYEYTDLQKEFLPENVVYELVNGIYFQDQEDLYEFLETYSS